MPTEMDTDDRRDEREGTFAEKYDRDLWLTALEEVGTAGTTEIHEKVEEICREKGIDEGEMPVWRTTYERLNKLEGEGEVNGEKIGNSTVWKIMGETRRQKVYEKTKERGPATAEALSEGTDIEKEDFREVLNNLKEDGKVESELMGDSIVWYVDPSN